MLQKISLEPFAEKKSASSDHSDPPSHSKTKAKTMGWQQEDGDMESPIKHNDGGRPENKRAARRKAFRMAPYPPRRRRLAPSGSPCPTERPAISHLDDSDKGDDNAGSDGGASFTKVRGTVEAAISSTRCAL